MNHAEVCPVCNGTGKVNRTQHTDSCIRIETCNGCSGQGWITVRGTTPLQYLTVYYD